MEIYRRQLLINHKLVINNLLSKSLTITHHVRKIILYLNNNLLVDKNEGYIQNSNVYLIITIGCYVYCIVFLDISIRVYSMIITLKGLQSRMQVKLKWYSGYIVVSI